MLLKEKFYDEFLAQKIAKGKAELASGRAF